MNNFDFYLRRIHSITGVVPIGFFLIEHIFSISTVLAGGQAFDQTVGHLAAIPAPILYTMEIVFIAIPLLFHGIYGAYIAMQAKNNVAQYGYTRNWQFYLQRMSAWYTLLFLVYHVGYLRFYIKAMGNGVIGYNLMHNHLANPLVFIIYAIGLVAAVYHFTNGLFTLSITWGIAVGPRAQSLVNKAAWGLCALMSIVGLAAMFKFVA